MAHGPMLLLVRLHGQTRYPFTRRWRTRVLVPMMPIHVPGHLCVMQPCPVVLLPMASVRNKQRRPHTHVTTRQNKFPVLSRHAKMMFLFGISVSIYLFLLVHVGYL